MAISIYIDQYFQFEAEDKVHRVKLMSFGFPDHDSLNSGARILFKKSRRIKSTEGFYIYLATLTVIFIWKNYNTTKLRTQSFLLVWKQCEIKGPPKEQC